MVSMLLGCGPAGGDPATGEAAGTPPGLPRVDGDRALEEVEALVALGLRDSGTPGARRAAEHLRDRLRAVGVEADLQTFEDPTPKGPVTFRNVIGRIPGGGEGLVLLGSHYDTKVGMPEGFEGANDSGSSSGLLVELGRILQAAEPLPFETWLVFFDGEECMESYGPRDGLHGSRHLAADLVESGRAGDVEAMILMDMVGDRDLNITLPRNGSPRLTSMAFAAAHDEGVRHLFGLSRYTILDDHVPFLEAGMPAVNLIDFEYGSEPGKNDYWHTADDTLDKLSPRSLKAVGDVTLRMLERLAADAAEE